MIFWGTSEGTSDWQASRRRHSSRPRLDIEQAEDLLLGQPQRWRRAVLFDQVVEELAFAFEDVGDAAFDGAGGDEASDDDGFLLADAVGAVDGLILDSRVPPAIEEEDVVGGLQIQADAAGAVAHKQDVFARVN